MVRVLSIKTISILLVTGTGVEAETFPFTRSLVALLPKGLDRNHRVPSCTMVDFDGTSNSARTSQKLGCAILESSIHGMFKASTNILALNDMLDLNDKLFSNHDVVRMIDDGCIHIIHHGNGGIYSERSVQYASKLEYSEAYRESLEVTSANKFSFGRTAASMSYDYQSGTNYSASGVRGLSEATAFWEIEVATIKNVCIKPCLKGMSSGCIHAYARPEMVAIWEKIAADPTNTTVDAADDFVKNLGMMIPNSWSYGDRQSATLKVEYEASSVVSSQDVSHAMSSSLSSAYGGLSGSVTAGMESAFEQSLNTSSSGLYIKSETFNLDTGPGTSVQRCEPYAFNDTDRQDCVSDYHADAGTWGSPFKVKSFVTVGDAFVASQVTRDQIAQELAAKNAPETHLKADFTAIATWINGLKHYYTCNHYSESEDTLDKACRWKYEPVPSTMFQFAGADVTELVNTVTAYDTKVLAYNTDIEDAELGYLGLDSGAFKDNLRVGTSRSSLNQQTWGLTGGYLCRAGENNICVDSTGNIVYDTPRTPTRVYLENYNTIVGTYDSIKLRYILRS
uniref:MACPF domain-containing protein n=1 Tax=Mucochytrium quahogii TaxID=96639 RepID=A0A7S2RFC1_9STRA|mmetsp:Transcript_15261/g.24794  ORF Transcript_15261/g.24794 Transcript_15261/m.24794 type:complete len:565 (+) Transcript_15261:35-1729(+)